MRALAAQNPEISEDNYRQVLGAEYKAQVAQWKRQGAKRPMQDIQVDPRVPRSKLISMLAGVDEEEHQRGGLHVYQMASTVGQDTLRGGDSLKWLVKAASDLGMAGVQRTLEIGSLSVDNWLLRDRRFGTLCRIDLNLQHPAILQQDFMERPLPQTEAERFGVVSCLLVLNFVAEAAGRYHMLYRVTQFLVPGGHFFLVLPRPCVDNSRYMDVALLSALMRSLGFHERKSHFSTKLYYALYEWHHPPVAFEYRKKELRPGSSRNNFYIDCRGSLAVSTSRESGEVLKTDG